MFLKVHTYYSIHRKVENFVLFFYNHSFTHKVSNMEEVISRFPRLAVKIFQSLDNQNLVESKVVNRTWKHFIEEKKFYHAQRIEKCISCSRKTLKKILQNYNSINTMEVASAVQVIKKHTKSITTTCDCHLTL